MSASLARSLHPQLGTARDLLERPVEEQRFFPTTLDSFHRLLPEGLARGEIIEIVGEVSSGRFSLVMTLLSTVTSLGDAAVLIDLGDHFDPQEASHDGVCLERLLWVRPSHLKQALVATETVLNGGFPFVALDLGAPPVPGGRGAQSSWLRLLAAVRSYQASLLIASPYRVSGTAATTVIETRQGRGSWRGDGSPRQLLRRLSSKMTLSKVRRRMPGASAPLNLHFHLGGTKHEGSSPARTVEPSLGHRRQRIDVA